MDVEPLNAESTEEKIAAPKVQGACDTVTVYKALAEAQLLLRFYAEKKVDLPQP